MSYLRPVLWYSWEKRQDERKMTKVSLLSAPQDDFSEALYLTLEFGENCTIQMPLFTVQHPRDGKTLDPFLPNSLKSEQDSTPKSLCSDRKPLSRWARVLRWLSHPMRSKYEGGL